VALAARRMPHHAGPARRHRVLAWFRLPRQGRESVGHPVGEWVCRRSCNLGRTLGAPVDLVPGYPISDEVIARLTPAARTAAFPFLDAPPNAETLVDRATDVPAIRITSKDGIRVRIAVSQWLPTTSP
jgi:hypothetical protein